MRHDEKANGKAAPTTPTGREMVSELARRSGAALTEPRRSPGMMCEQGQDWSRGMACLPQKLVHLVGYRDPGKRPSLPLPVRPMGLPKKPIPSDTPIG